MGLRGLVAAAVVGAIMSTISGLVNSTSTIFTLDIVQRGWGRDWSEERLVRVGRWSGGIALVIGALSAPVVMHWDSIFRYAQDIWAPMAAPGRGRLPLRRALEEGPAAAGPSPASGCRSFPFRLR